jgi:AraC-like DNA-binding protein
MECRLERTDISLLAIDGLEFETAARHTLFMIQAVSSVLPSMPAVTHLIEEIRVVSGVAGRSFEHVERLPDGTVSLLFRILECDAASHPRRGDLIVAGPRKRAFHKTVPSIPLALFVRLRPGAAFPIFGIQADELTNRIVALEELWGNDGMRLLEKLLSASGVGGMSELIQKAFYWRAVGKPAPSSAPIVGRALRLITETATPVRVNEIAASIGVSVRHLRRTFTALVGIGPKEFARVIRFHRAANMATSETNWTQIALRAGYYDQAHMIADFRALVGTTPEAFLKRVPSHRW